MAGSVPAPADVRWYRAIGDLGSCVAPALVAGLMALDAKEAGSRSRAQQLCGAFLWLDEGARRTLLERYSLLIDDARESAAVTFGLARYQLAADVVWSLWCESNSRRQYESRVAALWGLTDLQDSRAAAAVGRMLTAGERFYELLGFAAATGDEGTIAPLLARLDRAKDRQESMDCLMALGAITGRVGSVSMEQTIVRELGISEAARARELVSLLTSEFGPRVHEYYGAFGV